MKRQTNSTITQFFAKKTKPIEETASELEYVSPGISPQPIPSSSSASGVLPVVSIIFLEI
jgi:hypothetical protein